MDWSDVILLVAVAAILFLYIRLMRKNRRLRQMADEANRLRREATEAERRNRQLKQEMNYRDSIGETLAKVQSEPLDSVTLPIIYKAGEQYSTEYEVTAFEAAFHVCGICYGLAYLKSEYEQDGGKTKGFVVCDMGSANNGAELFLVSTNEYVLVVMLMIDAEPNTDLVRFSVTRHFDRAVADWTQQWLASPGTSMPLMEQHGGWDGYCTDDIDLNLLLAL